MHIGLGGVEGNIKISSLIISGVMIKVWVSTLKLGASGLLSAQNNQILEIWGFRV